jgi:hypothetical protein
MHSAWHPKPGECFLIDSGPVGKHLFVLVLETKEGNQHQVISVPVCTIRNPDRIDESCIINPGEHPFIKEQSFIEYRNARVDPIGHLLERVRERTFILQQPASLDLLQKIKGGLGISKFVKRYIRDLFSAH